MGFDFKDGNPAMWIFLGRMLNSAFKKHEIERPAKLRHHEIILKESADGSVLYMVAKGLGIRGYVIPYGEWQGQYSVSLNVERYSESGKKPRDSHLGSLSPARIKGEALQTYVDYAVVLFFDIVYSTTQERDADTRLKISRLFQQSLKRHKWRG